MNEIPQAKYILGHSLSEIQRLMLQAAILRPYTEHLLRNTEIGAGMRILDLGSGAGDVAMLVADLVGPSGSVIGIDHNPDVIALAKDRVERAGLAQVRFEIASVETFSDAELFDCVIGRYVLVHQPDPVGFLRAAARFVRPGGVLAFHEVDLTGGFNSCPTVGSWNVPGNLTLSAFQEVLPHYDSANRLIKHFADASLPFPGIFREAVVDGGAQSPLYNWLASTLRSVWPQLVEMGLVPEGLPDERLAGRVKNAVVRAQSQIEAPAQVCAWVRL